MASYALELSPAEQERYRRQAEATRERERALWEQAGVVPGASVLDLGCGPGATLGLLAPLVGGSGRLVGLDQDRQAVEAAQDQLRDAAVGDVHIVQAELPNDQVDLPPGSFDVVFLRHVLGHNGGREVALLARAFDFVRPGGTVYVVDTDLTMMRIQPPTAPVTELYERYDRWRIDRGDDPQVGIKLPELAAAAGFAVEHYDGMVGIMPRRPGARGPVWAARRSLVESGHASEDDLERWSREFDDLDSSQTQPLYFITGFTAIGRKATADR